MKLGHNVRQPKKLNGTWVLGLAAPAQLLCLESWLRAQFLPGTEARLSKLYTRRARSIDLAARTA